MKNRNLLLIPCLLLISLLSSCVSLQREFDLFFGGPAVEVERPATTPQPLPTPIPSEAPKTARVVIEKLDGPTAKTTIEVLWVVPKDPVDGFIIYYGYDRSDLRFMEKVYTSDIETVDDGQFGHVHRYALENVPPQKAMFVAISAFNGEQISERSPVFEIPSENLR